MSLKRHALPKAHLPPQDDDCYHRKWQR